MTCKNLGAGLPTLTIGVLVLMLATISFSSLSALAQPHPMQKVYKNCASLNRDYPGGVAKSKNSKNQGGMTQHEPKVNSKVYAANSSKDRDKDGIACEK